MVLVQFEKTYTHVFFKNFKLHLSFGLVQFRSCLTNSLVHVFPNCTRNHTITYTNCTDAAHVLQLRITSIRHKMIYKIIEIFNILSNKLMYI